VKFMAALALAYDQASLLHPPDPDKRAS